MGTELYSYALGQLDEEAFERWLCVFMKDRHQLRVLPQRIGRRGQAQAGVDLHFIDNAGRSVGVQAKAYVKTKLRASDIDAEVAKAHGFQPPLDELIICTLNDREAKLQAHVRGAQLHGHSNRITLLALQDLYDEVGTYQEARKHLLQNAIDGPQLATLMAIFDESPQGRLSLGQTDSGIRAGAQDAGLKAIEDWIDAGDPTRALAELEKYTGPAPDTGRRRIFLRAQFSLGNSSLVADAGRTEILLTSPDPWVLAYAAHAAAAQGDRESADRWLDRAMAVSDEAARPTIISARVRVLAEYGEVSFASLVDLATAAIGDPIKVAFALADAAFQLGDLTAAAVWYDKARNRQPHCPVGLQGNALGVQVFLLTEQMFDENANPSALQDVASELATLLARQSVRADGVRMPMLVNLGTAYRFLGDAARAAAAWDQALALPGTPESVWVQRCVLSTDDAVPLPAEDLVSRWGTTALARLIFACACTARGEFERSQGVLDSMPDAATLSAQDRAALLVERIRLETRDVDEAITSVHIDTALALAHDDGPTIPLFAWLIFTFKQASPAQSEEVRSVLLSMASDVPLDLERKIAMSEELLRLQMGEVALPWVPEMAAAAQDANGRILRVRAVSVLLHLYAISYQWAAAAALVEEVRRHHVDHPNLVWAAAHALVQAGDRPGALALLDDAIQAGQRNCDLIRLWARLALLLGQRRRAHRVLRELDVTPTSPHSYAKLFEARALLGVRDASTASPTAAEHVTPATAGKVLAAGLTRRPARALTVAAGRVVQLRVLDGVVTRFDEQVLISDSEGLLLPGIRVVTTRDYPWVADMIGHGQGDVVELASAPYEGMRAVIDSVLDLDRWNVGKAAELVQSVPQSTTGITTLSGSSDQLGEQIRQQAQGQRHQRAALLQQASAKRAWIGLAAASMHVTPRAFLRKQADWRPAGHSGMAPDIEFDDASLKKATRCVLDPVSLLLLIELGADTALASMPKPAIMTPQAVDLLFDWWYSLERVQRGTRGTLVAMPDGRVAIHELTGEDRRQIRRFWFRVRTFITEHVEIVASPAISERNTLNIARVLGPGIVSGMALAKERDWAYLAEELMIYGAARHIVGSPAASLHRFLVHCAAHRWCTDAMVVEWLAELIRRGWRWIGYPAHMLATALKLPEARRWRAFEALLGRLRRADLPVAVRAIDALFRGLDADRFVGVSVRRARELLVAALPPQLTKEHLELWAEQYSGKAHAKTRRALKETAKRRGRVPWPIARIDEKGNVDEVDADVVANCPAEDE